MKLLIVEDEVILREKYQSYTNSIFDSVESVDTFNDTLKKIKSSEFDVMLLDYNLPDGNGLDIVKEARKLKLNTLFIMITAYSKERLAIESLNLGVFRYLEKPVSKESLIKVVNEAYEEAKSRKSNSEITNYFLINENGKKVLIENYFLTQREIEIISEVLIHSKNKIVGERLGLSQGTVRNHLSNIYQKLHIATKDELKDTIMKCNNGEFLE